MKMFYVKQDNMMQGWEISSYNKNTFLKKRICLITFGMGTSSDHRSVTTALLLQPLRSAPPEEGPVTAHADGDQVPRSSRTTRFKEAVGNTLDAGFCW